MRFLKPVINLLAVTVALSISLACGGGGGGSSPQPVTPPIISQQPANQTVLEGTSATFTVVASSTAPLTYQWKKGSVNIPGANASSYSTLATVLADNGSAFSVAVTNSGGSVASTSATLTVNPAPLISSFTATPAVITLGGSSTLAFAFTGGTGSIDQGLGTVTSGTNLTVTPTATTTYTLRVDNGAGAFVTRTATVTVLLAPIAPIISVPALTTTGTTGLTASVVAQPGMTYLWTVSGGTITAGATTPQITFTAGAPGTLTLTCVISNAVLATASGSAITNVVAPPVATGLAASSIAPLYGSSVSLTPTFSGGTATVDNGIGAVTSASIYPTPALTAPITYTLTVTNAAGATATASVVVTPQTVTVAAISPASPNVTALMSLIFSSTVSGASNAALTWSATSGAMDPSTGSWTAPGAAGSSTITATSVADATKSASTIVTVVPAPVAAITTLGSAAAGRKGITASVAAQPGMTYAWTISGGAFTSATTGNQVTYTAGSVGTLTLNCTVTNAALLAASDSAIVNVVALPWINAFQASPVAVQSGATVALAFDFVGGTGSIDNAIGPVTSLVNVGINPTTTTVYTLTVTPPTGSPITQALTVTVGTLPVFSVDLPATQSATQSTNVTMAVTASASPAITGYQWYFNGAILPGKTLASLTLYSVTPAETGTYHVVATNPVGSTQSNTLTLTVNPIHTISGRVRLVGDGTGIPDVTVSLNTTPTPTTTVTDSSGNFSFQGLLDGSYILTPSMAMGTNVLFLPTSRAVTVANANALDRDFQAALGYTVSGTVNYPGVKTDRIYLRLDGGSGEVSPGICLVTKGAFAIRGVPPGTYTLTAWMDTLGNGNSNASNPVGTRAGVVVGFGDLTGADVTLADAASVNLSGLVPTLTRVDPTDGGALVRWAPLKDGNKVELAESYLIEWSTSNTFASVTGSATRAAQGQNNPMYIASALTNGIPYYFRLTANAGATNSLASASFGPVTPALPTGLNTVTGTVSFTGAASGPLVVGLFDQSTQLSYMVRIANPVSPQAFTIAGVPAGTAYLHFGILDQNNNGFIDPGDSSNLDEGDLVKTAGIVPSFLTVAGNLANQNLVLPNSSAVPYLGTSHQRYTVGTGMTENYGLQFFVRGNIKLPINMTLLVGPTVLDVGKPATGKDFAHWFNHGELRPTLGAVHTLRVGYSDATSEDIPMTVNTVLDDFPTILSMTGSPTIPTFNWAAPIPPPSLPYSYRMWFAFKNGSTIWQYPTSRDMPSTQLSVPFNLDGQATPAMLTPGINYTWSITLRDTNGNSAQNKVDFTP